MRLVTTQPFERSYKKLPQSIQKKTDKILKFLVSDLRHPSVRAKKIQGAQDIWEGRVDISHSPQALA